MNREPWLKHSPSTGTLPLMAIGTPANGRASPGVSSSAAASARSPSTSMKALSAASRASMRRSAASTTSRGLAPPARTSAATSAADVNDVSSIGPGSLRESDLLKEPFAYDRMVRDPRYRWAVLAAGVLAQAALSAVQLGLPAIAPALRDE